MRAVLERCDAIICHGAGMTNLALDHGKPVLILPMQTEQLMTSVRISQLEAGVYLPLEGNPGKLRGLLERLLGEPGLGKAARAFADARPYGDPGQAIETIVSTCNRLLSGGAAIIPAPSASESDGRGARSRN